MVVITEQINIKRDKVSVFAFISNYENDTAWRSGVLEMRQSTKGFTHAGTITKEKIKIFGFKSVNTGKVTNYHENTKVDFEVIKGVKGISGYRWVKPANNSSILEYSLTFDVRGFFAPLIKLLHRSYRKRVRQDLLRVKDILERNN